MKIVIAGGTGFLGRPLTAACCMTATTSSSSPAARPARCRRRARGHVDAERRSGPWAAEIDGAGAVVNLAGESIAGKRWTDAQKQRILDSRVQATRSLVDRDRLRQYRRRLRQRIGSRLLRPARRRAGDRGHAGRIRFSRARLRAMGAGSAARRERSHARRVHPHGDRARARTAARCRRCCRRSGSAPADRSDRDASSGRGFIARIGSRLVQWAIATPAASGAVNVTAPRPVTSAEFARALGRAMHRPAFMPAPGVRAAPAARRNGGRAAALRPKRRAGKRHPRRLSRSATHGGRCAASDFADNL